MDFVRRFLIGGVLLLALPVMAFAQEATLTGTVTDSTGAVLPGVTVTAVNDATGNTFDAVTDERGHLPDSRARRRLSDHGAASGLLDRASGPACSCWSDRRRRCQPADVAVDGSGNGDRHRRGAAAQRDDVEPGRQRRPDAGAGAAGQRPQLDGAGAAGAGQPDVVDATPSTPLPDRNGGEAREFQLNMDGQQVSNEIGTGGQPRYSQDAIAEFQFVANRFDATQGRTSGVQVNAITKSGTQPVLGPVPRQLPQQPVQRGEPGARPRRSDQQPAAQRRRSADRSCWTGCTTSATSSTSASRAAASGTRRTRSFNVELHGDRTIKMGGVRVDYQILEDAPDG